MAPFLITPTPHTPAAAPNASKNPLPTPHLQQLLVYQLLGRRLPLAGNLLQLGGQLRSGLALSLSQAVALLLQSPHLQVHVWGEGGQGGR